MNRLIITSLIGILLTACSTKFDKEQAAELTSKIEQSDSISPEDARNILNQLEMILSEVCNKAEREIKRGVSPINVRDSLCKDPEYTELGRQAGILDNALLNYMDSCRHDALIRGEYEQVLKRNIRRARSLGLN